ncbi:hypothetical protein ACP70R_018066 [Stipagrostis hirtigluma subsp. patula]
MRSTISDRSEAVAPRAAMADHGFPLPTDAFVEILLRLPTSSRRRLRLVCKRWRDVIDKRTPERQVCSKILACISGIEDSFCIRILREQPELHPSPVWEIPCSGYVYMVGTCNGLICLHEIQASSDDGGGASAVTVANLVTGENLVLPPVPAPWRPSDPSRTRWRYSFGYHPTTGKYKVVHIPCGFAATPRQAVLQVFTLGATSWRSVPVLTPDASYSDESSNVLISVDGSAYWLTAFTNQVMALDLEDERVTSFEGPPVLRLLQGAACQLTIVHARLGVVVCRRMPAITRLDVWALEGRGKPQPRWSRMYSVVEPSGADQGRWITAPCFTHGEYVLSRSSDGIRVYRRKVGDLTNNAGKDSQLLPLGGEELVMSEESDDLEPMTSFAYAETLEPLPNIHGRQKWSQWHD